MTTKKESEILAHMIQDHMKREVKELTKLRHIDDQIMMAKTDEEVASFQDWREHQRKRCMVHRHWLKEIAELVGWTIKSFGDKRDIDPRTGIKGICVTKFEEWI